MAWLRRLFIPARSDTLPLSSEWLDWYGRDKVRRVFKAWKNDCELEKEMKIQIHDDIKIVRIVAERLALSLATMQKVMSAWAAALGFKSLADRILEHELEKPLQATEHLVLRCWFCWFRHAQLLTRGKLVLAARVRGFNVSEASIIAAHIFLAWQKASKATRRGPPKSLEATAARWCRVLLLEISFAFWRRGALQGRLASAKLWYRKQLVSANEGKRAMRILVLWKVCCEQSRTCRYFSNRMTGLHEEVILSRSFTAWHCQSSAFHSTRYAIARSSPGEPGSKRVQLQETSRSLDESGYHQETRVTVSALPLSATSLLDSWRRHCNGLLALSVLLGWARMSRIEASIRAATDIRNLQASSTVSEALWLRSGLVEYSLRLKLLHTVFCCWLGLNARRMRVEQYIEGSAIQSRSKQQQRFFCLYIWRMLVKWNRTSAALFSQSERKVQWQSTHVVWQCWCKHVLAKRLVSSAFYQLLRLKSVACLRLVLHGWINFVRLRTQNQMIWGSIERAVATVRQRTMLLATYRSWSLFHLCRQNQRSVRDVVFDTLHRSRSLRTLCICVCGWRRAVCCDALAMEKARHSLAGAVRILTINISIWGTYGYFIAWSVVSCTHQLQSNYAGASRASVAHARKCKQQVRTFSRFLRRLKVRALMHVVLERWRMVRRTTLLRQASKSHARSRAIIFDKDVLQCCYANWARHAAVTLVSRESSLCMQSQHRVDLSDRIVDTAGQIIRTAEAWCTAALLRHAFCSWSRQASRKTHVRELASGFMEWLDAVEKELVDHLVPTARELARVGADYGLALREPWRLLRVALAHFGAPGQLFAVTCVFGGQGYGQFSPSGRRALALLENGEVGCDGVLALVHKADSEVRSCLQPLYKKSRLALRGSPDQKLSKAGSETLSISTPQAQSPLQQTFFSLRRDQTLSETPTSIKSAPLPANPLDGANETNSFETSDSPWTSHSTKRETTPGKKGKKCRFTKEVAAWAKARGVEQLAVQRLDEGRYAVDGCRLVVKWQPSIAGGFWLVRSASSWVPLEWALSDLLEKRSAEKTLPPNDTSEYTTPRG